MGAGVQKRPARKHAAQHPAQSELTYSAGARQHADAGRERGALPRGDEPDLQVFGRSAAQGAEHPAPAFQDGHRKRHCRKEPY